MGILPKAAGLVRLAASLLIEQNNEWIVGRRYTRAPQIEAQPPLRDSDWRCCYGDLRPVAIGRTLESFVHSS